MVHTLKKNVLFLIEKRYRRKMAQRSFCRFRFGNYNVKEPCHSGRSIRQKVDGTIAKVGQKR